MTSSKFFLRPVGRSEQQSAQDDRNDTIRFFRTWISEPARVGAAFPSGPGLANLITSRITTQMVPILELGPGTGSFTAALVRRGIRPEDITLVESGSGFAEILRARFPDTELFQIDAARLGPALRGDGRLHGAAVSGLPLLSIPAAKVLRILVAAFSQMSRDASLYQFTYGWRCPVRENLLNRLGLTARRLGSRLDNAPPATVYRIYRQV